MRTLNFIYLCSTKLQSKTIIINKLMRNVRKIDFYIILDKKNKFEASF